MKFVRTLENFIGNQIEGFFNHKFSSTVQPIEIAKQLRSVIETKKITGVKHIQIPDQFSIFLTVKDYEQLKYSFDLIYIELTAYIQEYAKKHDYYLQSKPTLKFQANKLLKNGTVDIFADFSAATFENSKVLFNGDLSSTQVFNKPKPIVEALRKLQLCASLTVVEGNDVGTTVRISLKRCNLGRRDTNELPLNDANISRLHAYVIFEHGYHVLYDAKSLNGTYVNLHRIAKKQLNSGDKIGLGNTVILYEVTDG